MPTGLFMTDDHRYYFNGSGPYPSVTTIIDVMSKQALMTWKAKAAARAMYRAASADLAGLGLEEDAVLNALKAADSQRDTAGRLGSSVHLLAHMEGMGLQGQEIDSKGFNVSEQEKPYLEAFRDFLGRYSASSIVSSEKAVLSENGYGGTFDLLMQICPVIHDHAVPPLQCSPELWLIDIKTSKGYYPEYGLQLAAYRWADSIILEGDPRPYPMPQVQRTGVLHLRPDQYSDTGWRLIEYPTDYQKDYIPFLGLLEAYKWREEGRFTKSQLNKR